MEDEPLGMEAKQLAQEDKQLICDKVEELKSSNAVLLAENNMFERFLCRMDQLDPHAGASGFGGTGSTQLDVGMRGKRQSSRSAMSDGLHELTLEQKLYVAQREVAETKQDQTRVQQRYEKIQDDHKASLKEAELRLEEIRRAKNAFERKLHAHTKDHRLEKKEPEKLLQYVEDKSKATQAEKLHLKNQALKVLEKKLEQQLQQKRDAAKAEYEEIFQEYGEPSMDKNLVELQGNSLQVHRSLVSHKEKLQSATSESNELSSDIHSRRQKLQRLEGKLQGAEEVRHESPQRPLFEDALPLCTRSTPPLMLPQERCREEALNQRLRRQVSEYEAPGVAEYMRAKEKLRRLQQSVHTWEKKVEVAQMTLRAHVKAAAPCGGGEHIPVRLPCIAEHGRENLMI
ncbi:cilia- and flagella-associated protein 263 isoform X1 [Nelusetta ayraudi]|uniref:cilia- and flagella-associated protein 263 isoform X1 n=1 Tax=Nelusetta ayraudi TaxID=303726 RepID=UPI003F726FD9